MQWVPNTDTDARDDVFLIKCELAGMKRTDLDLTVEAIACKFAVIATMVTDQRPASPNRTGKSSMALLRSW